jgi:hypothetical protein
MEIRIRLPKRMVARGAGFVMLTIAVHSVASAQPPTRIAYFQPAVPPGRPLKGSCWTGSIASDRPGAWRCMANNGIYDLCFSVRGNSGLVVCVESLEKPGTAIKLTKPLPAETESSCKNCVWTLQLADGSMCSVAGTGTLSMVGGEPLRWGCDNPACSGKNCPDTGILGHIKTGRLWIAQKGDVSLDRELLRAPRQTASRGEKGVAIED